MTKSVLGIKIDDISPSEALEKIDGWVKGRGKHYIVTPNPEIIVAAQKDAELKDILNKADLSIPDGVGLKLSGVRNRMAGIDLMLDLIKLASQKGYSVGFIGGKEGVAKKAAEVLTKQYPNLKVSFAESGGEVDENGESRIMNYESGKIRNGSNYHNSKFMTHDSDILFVAFGHGKQEKWIARYLNELPVNPDSIGVKVAMAVGGGLDYVAGGVMRAPKPLRDIGLEWLFRLIVQPWRIKRQLSLIKFILLIFFERGTK